MESAPVVIPITDFRRDAAGIIGGTVASGTPVYVTQHSRVTAVIVSRQTYQGLLHRLAILEAAAAEHVDPAPNAVAKAARTGESCVPDSTKSGGHMTESRACVAGREPLPGSLGYSSTLVKTRFGLTDPETAAFLIAEGCGVGTGDVGTGGIGAGGVEASGFEASSVGASGFEASGVGADGFEAVEGQAGSTADGRSRGTDPGGRRQ